MEATVKSLASAAAASRETDATASPCAVPPAVGATSRPSSAGARLSIASDARGGRRHPLEERLAPGRSDRLWVYLTVLLPWLLLYGLVQSIGIPRRALVGFLPFEHGLPVLQWTTLIYLSVYPFAVAAPLVCPSARELRRLCRRGWAASALIFPFYVAFPIVAPPRPFVPEGWPGRMLAVQRSLDSAACALPSFHTVWAFVAAAVYVRRWPQLRVLWWGLAALIAASCVTTGNHSVADVLAALALLPFLFRIGRGKA